MVTCCNRFSEIKKLHKCGNYFNSTKIQNLSMEAKTKPSTLKTMRSKDIAEIIIR